jgi:hypothetical protein
MQALRAPLCFDGILLLRYIRRAHLCVLWCDISRLFWDGIRTVAL